MTNAGQVRRRDGGVLDATGRDNRDLDFDHATETGIDTQTLGLVAALYLTRVTQSDESHVYIWTDAVGFDDG